MKYFRTIGLALILAACSQAAGSEPTTAPQTTATAEATTTTPVAPTTTTTRAPTTTTTRAPTTTTQPQFTRSEENAIRSAEAFLDYTAFSRSGLIDQLVYEGFTAEQAAYGVDKTGL